MTYVIWTYACALNTYMICLSAACCSACCCCSLPSTGPTSSSTSESRVESLLKLFSQQQLPNTVADNLAKRSGPIRPNSSGQINNVGQHFPLVGIQSSVDHLIKVLSHMHRRFKSGDDDEFFLEGLQLLRAVGGPGTGKSTLLRNIWGLLQQRIQEVKDSAADRDRELWEQWKYWEVPELQERMQAWGPYPWVYVISLDATSGKCDVSRHWPYWACQRCNQKTSCVNYYLHMVGRCCCWRIVLIPSVLLLNL